MTPVETPFERSKSASSRFFACPIRVARVDIRVVTSMVFWVSRSARAPSILVKPSMTFWTSKPLLPVKIDVAMVPHCL